MAGDLEEFVRTLRRLATCMLDTTLNFICGVLLSISMLLPWRLIAVVGGACKSGCPIEDQSGFRQYALQQLLASLVDVIAVPLGVAGALWPLRWKYLSSNWTRNLSSPEEIKIQMSMELRRVWCVLFCSSLGDVLSLPFLAVAALAPWRAASVFTSWPTWAKRKDFDAYLDGIRWLGFEQGFASILDAPCFVWSLACLIAPSRWRAWLRFSFVPRKGDDNDANCLLRTFWIAAPFLAIIDILAFLCAIFAVIDPLCIAQFLKSFSEHWQAPPANRIELEWYLEENLKLRRVCFLFGLISISDVVSLPPAVVVFGTFYRSRSARTAFGERLFHASCCKGGVRGASDVEAAREPLSSPETPALDDAKEPLLKSEAPAVEDHFALSKCLWQKFALVCLDVVTLPPMLPVLLTCHRWSAVRQAMLSDNGLDYHRAVVIQFAWFCLDLLTLPFFAVVLLTWYRSKPLRDVLSSEDRLRYHMTAFKQFFLLVLDLVTLPSLLLTLVAFHRFRKVRPTMGDADDKASYHPTVVKQSLIAIADIITLPFLIVSFVFHYRFPPVRKAMVEFGEETPYKYHSKVIYQFLLVVLDILTFPLLLVTIIFHYRFKPVRDSMALTETWPLEYHKTVICQAFFVLLDLITLPLLFITLIFHHRFAPVRKAMAESEGSALNYHEKLLMQTFLVLLDIITLPCLLLVFIFHYRWPPVRKSMGESDYHGVVIVHFVLVCLDILVLPCLILVLVTWYRWHELRKSFPSGEVNLLCEYNAAAIKNMLVIIHDAVLFLLCTVLIVTIYRAPRVKEVMSSKDEKADARCAIWTELGQLLADLPFFPLLVVLIVTGWRADIIIADLRKSTDDCSRRITILYHTALLLRDLVGFLVVAVLLVTLARFPKFLLTLWSKRSRPAKGQPRLTATKATFLMPRSVYEPATLKIHATQAEARRREDIGRLCLNLVSADLFDEVKRIVGQALVDFGRGFLPLKVTDGNWLNYNDVLDSTCEVTFRFHASRTQRDKVEDPLSRMNGDICACAQLEHVYPDGQNEVLLRLAIPLRIVQQMISQPGQEVELPQEVFEPGAAEKLCGKLVEGAGIRDGMWICAFTQLKELLLDALHIPFFVLTAIAPWRLPSCVWLLCSPESAWYKYVARRFIRMSNLYDEFARMYRYDLEPTLNSSMKKHGPKIEAKDIDFSLGNRYPSQKRTYMETWMTTELSYSAATLPQLYEVHSTLREAVKAYWPSLVFAANVEQMQKRIDANEHAYLLHEIVSTQQRADVLLSASATRLQSSEASIASGRGCGLLGKPDGVQRRLTRLFAARAFADWAVILLAVLLILTVYRLPSIAKDTMRKGDATRGDRLRLAIYNHATLFVWDLWNFFTAVFASFLALITLLRFLEFLEDVIRSCSSFVEVREAGFSRAKEALFAFYELLTLVLLWKTYTFLVRATVFVLLMPSSGIKGCKPWVRMLLWTCLCSLPWILPRPELCLVPMFVLALISLISGHAREERDKVHAIFGGVRFTMPNLMVLVGLGSDAAFLVYAPAMSSLCTEASLVVAIVVGILYLLAVTVPIAVEGYGEEDDLQLKLRKSALYHAAVQLLRRCAMIPTAAVLLAHIVDRSRISRFAELLLLFVVATCTLGHELQGTEHMPLSLGLDIILPPVYLSGMAFTQMLLLVSERFSSNILLRIGVAALAPIWAFTYRYIARRSAADAEESSMDEPKWLPALRESAAVVPLMYCVLVWMSKAAGQSYNQHLVALSAFSLLGIITAGRLVFGYKESRRIMQEKASRAGIPKVFAALASRGALLCRAAEAEGFGDKLSTLAVASPTSSAAAAAALEEFEKHVRVERLSEGFLKNHSSWVEQLRVGRGSFETVVSLAEELLREMQTPPDRLLTIMALKKSCAASKRIGAPIWTMIMQMVGGTHPLDRLTKPMVGMFIPGDPCGHLKVARQMMSCATRSHAQLREMHNRDEPIADTIAREVASMMQVYQELAEDCVDDPGLGGLVSLKDLDAELSVTRA